jgi:hypothetical protein
MRAVKLQIVPAAPNINVAALTLAGMRMRTALLAGRNRVHSCA